MPDNTFAFSKDGKFLNNQVAATINVTADPTAAARLAANAPFSAGTTKVGTLSATVSGSTGDLKFGNGADTVSFSGSASTNSTLAIYDSTSALLQDLDPDPNKPILEGLSIDAMGATQFVLLDWGYNISSSGKGSVALGVGASASFSADGSTDGLFAVIRGFATRPGSRDAVQSAISSWMLPGQVTSADDLQPATWLIAEVDGSIGLKIGAQYGYTFNWIRTVDLGNLSGDIGLKIQAAVDAAIGFDVSGKYLVALGRESVNSASKTIRLRLFKMTKKGWTFAFNASVGVTGSTGTLLPAQIDEFVAAVFGVHGAQVVEDLKLFDKWADPSTPLPDLISGFVSDFVTKELKGFAGTEIQKFQEARQRIATFLQDWNDLGHTASTMLWSAIQKTGGPVKDLLDFLEKTNGLDDSGLKSLIETELGKAGFGASPLGQMLEAVTSNDVLSILNSSVLLGKVRSAAQMVLSIANGKILDNLVQFVNQKLDIDDVEKIVNEADFDNLDPWLKAKLAKFLGAQQVLFADLDKVRAGAKAIRDKASVLYQTALKALNNTYTAALHYVYAKTTTSTALIDVSFDFVANPGVGAFLKMALQGDFKDLLVSTASGISIKSATLTHGVRRQSHVQIVFPYFSDTIDHINNSLATMKVEEDQGRLFVYDFNASDNVTRAHKWSSNLTLTGTLKVGAGVNVFVTDAEVADSMTFSYSLRQAQTAVRDVQFEYQIQPLVSPYFLNAFGGPQSPDAASLHEWVGSLEYQSFSINKTGAGSLGNLLTSLDVSLPGSVVAAWFKAPASASSPAYLSMSRGIQVALRRFTQMCYFGDPGKYADLAIAPAFFVYGCLPVSTNVSVDADGNVTLNAAGGVYWNWPDAHMREIMVDHPSIATSLSLRVSGIRDVLRDSDKFKSSAKFYDPKSLDDYRKAVLNDPGNKVFQALLFTEAETIRHAQDAGIGLAQFSANAGTDPEKAIQVLEDFASNITDAFNKGLGSLVRRLPEFSAMIFLEASRAFDPTIGNPQPLARLDAILLKTSAPATINDAYLSGTAPDSTVVAFEQPVIGIP